MANESGEMIKIRGVQSIALKDGRVLCIDSPELRNHGHVLVMYDEGVQMENDNGATLYTWDEITLVELEDVSVQKGLDAWVTRQIDTGRGHAAAGALAGHAAVAAASCGFSKDDFLKTMSRLYDVGAGRAKKVN